MRACIHISVLSQAELCLQGISKSLKSLEKSSWYGSGIHNSNIIWYLTLFAHSIIYRCAFSVLLVSSSTIIDTLKQNCLRYPFNYDFFFPIKEAGMFVWITSALEKLWWNNHGHSMWCVILDLLRRGFQFVHVGYILARLTIFFTL